MKNKNNNKFSNFLINKISDLRIKKTKFLDWRLGSKVEAEINCAYTRPPASSCPSPIASCPSPIASCPASGCSL